MWANHDWYNIQPATFDNSRIALTQGRGIMGAYGTLSPPISLKITLHSLITGK